MMLSENKLVISGVAKELGIETFQAGVMPEDKHNVVPKLQESSKIVGMGGHGIHNAP
jgi:Cu+-exporting ATPase